jgi:protein phosphatase
MAGIQVQVKGLSLTGPVREENQDSIRIRLPDNSDDSGNPGILLALADGMGGHAHGGLASRVAIDTLFTALAGPTKSPGPALQRAVEQANLAVHQEAFRLNVGLMGTTLTVVNIINNRLYLAHVGDSRAYLIRGGKATCLTHDHTVAGEMVRLQIITPDKVRNHQRRSILNKSLGKDLFVKPELNTLPLKDNDVLILCSDGLWAYVEDHEFAKMTGEFHDPTELSQNLIDLALKRNTDDNVSVIALRLEQLAEPAPLPATVTTGWRQALSFLGLLF